MVASIMSNIYENTDRSEELPNLSPQLSENKENIQHLPETVTSQNYEDVIRSDVQELTKQLGENVVPSHNSVNLLATASAISSQNYENKIRTDALKELTNQLRENFVPYQNSVNLLATSSAIDADLSEMIPIASELVHNLTASISVIDLTPDTQHDSDISIVNSPVRPKPVVIDLTTDSQPELDISSLMEQPATTINSSSCVSKVARKRKQPSILQYTVKSQKFAPIMKKENKFIYKQLNVPLKVNKYENEMDEEVNIGQSPAVVKEFVQNSSENTTALSEELGTKPMEEDECLMGDGDVPYEKEEEVATNNLVEYAPYSPVYAPYSPVYAPKYSPGYAPDPAIYATALSEDLRINPMEEDESLTVNCDIPKEDESYASVPETIEEFRTSAMEEEESSTVLSETPFTEESISNLASIDNEMANISKISFSENLDIDFDVFIQNWNTETLNTDFTSNEVKSQDLIVSPAETNNLPILPVVEEIIGKTDEIEEADNLLCSENIEMENLSMPFYNSENFNIDYDFQSKELNSLKSDESETESEVDSL